MAMRTYWFAPVIPFILNIGTPLQPFVRQKANEEIANPSLLHDFLPTLAQLLSFEVLDVQVAATEALLQFATGACTLLCSGREGK